MSWENIALTEDIGVCLADTSWMDVIANLAYVGQTYVCCTGRIISDTDT